MSFDSDSLQIQEICSKVCSGGTPSTRVKEFYIDGTIPWIKTKEVNNCKVFSAETYITEDAITKSSAKLIPENSVIIAMYGNGDTAGRVAINKIPVATNQACCNLILDPAKADYRFVFYFLRTQYQKLVDLKNGGAQQNLNAKILREYPFPNTPRVKQTKIADFLEQLDDKIALNTQTNQTLEQMAQAIFKSWFVNFDPVKAKMNGEQPEGMDAATASLFPEKLVESELGLIPDGWEVKSFKKVIDKYVDNRGKTPPIVEDGIPLVEVKHLPESSAFPKLSTNKRVTEETFKTWFRVHVEHKDVLISTVGTIGRTSFVKNTNFGIAQNVLGLRFGKVVEPEYMFYTIKAHRFQHDMDARLVTTVQSSIKRKDLDTIDILVPPSNVQKEFCKLIGNLLDGQYSKNAENINLASLRDTLLPKLLSGEIELEQTESIVEAV
ncbi:restriction endonuclease subunit S [Photobacterium carnosum]|uniref:restriction endonuclease subunit S n=1 Tax=Photobacterium carnosum TaxID=2023717 RepID=UPI001E3C5693|nr:restriction endonuclease subunit S [Photobacterium carnosum]